ncbi:dopamine receptor 1-like [Anneissia japonica]|uniref:dopamine receptor 1-like n=1 Tax=Anneissia japonica TaxID=1529436 RepID=UPI0014258B29|nr:dopamine receptor 1-like [Anneissia japonica]XP_033106649.1 dopamine receptor 1-like [Anneissia japonica]
MMLTTEVDWSCENTSVGNGTDDSNEDEKFTLAATITMLLVLGTIVLASIIGNILVCLAVATYPKLRKTANSFIVSLAMADLLVSILVMTFAISNDIRGYWSFGKSFCTIWISFDVMFSTASIFNLCAISVDRYMHIKKPLHYYQWMTPTRALVTIMFVWIMSALVSFMPIQLGWHEGNSGDALPMNVTDALLNDDADDKLLICTLEDINLIYATLSSFVSFVLPCLVMTSIYSRIFVAVREHVRNAKQGRIGNYDSRESGFHSPNAVRDHKAAVTLGIIMGVFLFCWVPFFTVNVVSSFCPDCSSPMLFSVLTWLGYCNSTLNPLIYGIFNKDFRFAFKSILRLECLSARHKRNQTFVTMAGPIGSRKNCSGNIPLKKNLSNSASQPLIARNEKPMLNGNGDKFKEDDLYSTQESPMVILERITTI